jgi:hypothetical protein
MVRSGAIPAVKPFFIKVCCGSGAGFQQKAARRRLGVSANGHDRTSSMQRKSPNVVFSLTWAILLSTIKTNVTRVGVHEADLSAT